MTEFLSETNTASEEPAKHYHARALKLSLTTLDSSNAEFSVVAKTDPGDFELLAAICDDESIESDLGAQFLGGDDPMAEYDAATIESATRLARQLTRLALTLTENDWPPLRIELDAELSVFAGNIFDEATVLGPQDSLF